MTHLSTRPPLPRLDRYLHRYLKMTLKQYDPVHCAGFLYASPRITMLYCDAFLGTDAVDGLGLLDPYQARLIPPELYSLRELRCTFVHGHADRIIFFQAYSLETAVSPILQQFGDFLLARVEPVLQQAQARGLFSE